MIGVILEIKEDGTMLAYAAFPASIIVFRDTKEGGVQVERVDSDFLHNLSSHRLTMALEMANKEKR